MKSRCRAALAAAWAGVTLLAGESQAARFQHLPPGTGDGAPNAIVIPAAADSFAPSVLLLSPNTYRVWAMGTLQKITWRATDDRGVASVDIGFSPDSGATWLPIAAAVPNSGLYTWKVANVRTAGALIQVTARDTAGNEASDRSDAAFEIKDRLAPTMAVTTPDGGQVWLTGSTHKVTWKATDNVAVTRIDLSYSANGGATWTTIQSRLANTGSYFWTLPMNVVSSAALVKAAAQDSAGNATSDASNATFEMRDGLAPVMTVTTPNGGQLWDVGSSRTVTWKATDNVRVTEVDLAYSLDSGSIWIPIASGISNTGKYTWIVPPTPSTSVLFRATARDSMSNSNADLGNAPFTIRDTAPPWVTLLAPNGAAIWPADGARDITWTAGDNVAVTSVDLLYSNDGGNPWTTIATGIANDGSYRWTAPLAPSTRSRVKIVVRDAAGNAASDTSDAAIVVDGSAVSLHKLISMRADSANGLAPAVTPGAASPWVDLVGDHDAYLTGFNGSRASGWVGDGSPARPWMLEFAGEEPGWNSHAWIPAGSVPELQTVGPVSAAVWFKTGWNGPRDPYEYVLEWVQEPAAPYDPEFEGRGMSIVVQNGAIQVYDNPWIDVCPALPATWYHVAVVKDTMDLRVYVNGRRLYAGAKAHQGTQQSEIALGASIFRRFEGGVDHAAFSDIFSGSIAQFDLWEGKLRDEDALAAFRADSARYLGAQPAPPESAIVRLDASRADGAAPYAIPSSASPWVDLEEPRNDFHLVGFDGTAASGWIGDGSEASPYRLQFDGVDDAATIDAASVPELLDARAITTSIAFRTGPEVASSTRRYLVEWLHSFGASPGLSIGIDVGKLRMYRGAFAWSDLADVTPDTEYRLAVVKGPGSVRVFLNGALAYSGNAPNFGAPHSGIVLGASTWRGPTHYGDHFTGSIASVSIWARALSDAEISGGATVRAARPILENAALPSHGLALAGAKPNPARGALHVHFALPGSGRASLELLDVNGRRVAAREVGSLGAGRHAVRLGEGASIRPGVYWLRLAQDGRALTRKTIVVE